MPWSQSNMEIQEFQMKRKGQYSHPRIRSGAGASLRLARSKKFLFHSGHPVFFLVLSVLALSWWAGVDLIHAQDAGQQRDNIAGPVRIDRSVVVGGYDLFVEAEASNLSLGTALVSVAVLNAVTGEPVPGAHVAIHTFHTGYGETGWATALPVPERPEIYRARMKLEYPGSVGPQRRGGWTIGPGGIQGWHPYHSGTPTVLGRFGGIWRHVGDSAMRSGVRYLEHSPRPETQGDGQCGMTPLRSGTVSFPS